MPRTTIEAAAELQRMLKERDLNAHWVARRLGIYPMWVSRRVRGVVSLSVEDYTRIKEVIELVPPPPVE